MNADRLFHAPLRSFTIDRVTVIFVLLVLAVQAPAIASAGYLAGLESSPSGQQTDVELGFAFAGILVVESVLLVLAWRSWHRVSVAAKRLLTRVALGATGFVVLDLFGVSLGVLYRTGELLSTAIETIALGGVIAVAFLGYRRVRARGWFWILFNLAGLSLGIAIVAMFGSVVAPIVMLPIMILSLGWDYVAVKLSGLMEGIVAASSAAAIPNHLIIPRKHRVEWDAVTAWLGDMDGREKPPSVDGVIGVGDLAVPGIFTVSLWVAGAEHVALSAMLGTVLAIVVLRDVMSRTSGGVPGLPWLNTGALAGFVAGVLITGTPVLTALGI